MNKVKLIELMKSKSATAGSFNDGWNKAIEDVLRILRRSAMTQYQVTFEDDSIEYIEALDVKFSHGKAVFELRHGRTLTLLYVISVEALALA